MWLGRCCKNMGNEIKLNKNSSLLKKGSMNNMLINSRLANWGMTWKNKRRSKKTDDETGTHTIYIRCRIIRWRVTL